MKKFSPSIKVFPRIAVLDKLIFIVEGIILFTYIFSKNLYLFNLSKTLSSLNSKILVFLKFLRSISIAFFSFIGNPFIFIIFKLN